MTRQALRDTLARLHAELEDAEPLDAALRADLERAIAEIREVIEHERPAAAAEVHPLSERLEELALRFEQSHPLLTQSIAGVVRALGAMGI
jgi:signal transduction histidine kinase